VSEPSWHGRSLRTPRQDFAVLADPPLPAALDVAKHNHAALAGDLNLQGRTLAQMRAWTREEVLSAARDYTAELLNATASADGAGEPDLTAASTADLLFVAGHQPALYHPGVWAKNFAVHEMATRTGGMSLNLSVDTDLMSANSIRVPVQSGEAEPRIERVPFDADRPRGPWEENAILDRSLFESFGERVCDKMAEWQVNPLLREQWPYAVRASQKSPLLKDCLIASRLRLERRWGVTNLELPISRMCELDPFLWFAGHILAHLPRFVAVHNEVLAEFRQVNHIRSKTHPVPELKSKGDCHEAPFWVWRKGDSVRSRVFARQEGREIVLSDGKAEFARLRLSPGCDACCAVEVLRKLPEQGIRFRARALTTTLFSRLCLADLFVHGIGGAKYDEMTDRIMCRFLGVTPPGFLTLTASLYLPLTEKGSVSTEDETRRVRLLRELRWNADRHLASTGDAEARELIAQKSALLSAMTASSAIPQSDQASHARPFRQPTGNFERFRQMQDINHRLAEKAASLTTDASDELSQIRRRLATHSLLHDREFAFSLYPEDKLRQLMGSLYDGNR
jgi:hypothetical protein